MQPLNPITCIDNLNLFSFSNTISVKTTKNVIDAGKKNHIPPVCAVTSIHTCQNYNINHNLPKLLTLGLVDGKSWELTLIFALGFLVLICNTTSSIDLITCSAGLW